MATEKLWTMGNRIPSEFVTELEMARRKAEKHRKATPEAWQDYVALRKLVGQAVGKLLMLEDERADFMQQLTINPPPEGMKPEEADALCQDMVGGTLGHISHDAFVKGWRDGAIYRAMIAYGEYMLAWERRTMGTQPEKAWGPHRPQEAGSDDGGFETLPPFGTPRGNRDTESI